jgi:ankyrin repeat protein
VVVYILGSAGQTLSQNKDAQRRFEEAIGAITNTNPVIETVELLSEKQGEEEKIDVPEGQNLYRVTLRLDTEYCSDQCINSVEEAVKFLNAYYASGNKDIAGFSYVRSDTEEGPTEGPTSGTTSSTVTAIAVTFIVVAFLGLFVVGGVLVGKKRKVIRAKIFYPGQSQVDDSTHDRSPPNKKRKVAQTDLASGTLVSSTEESSITASCASGDYIRDGSKAAKMEGSSKITWADYKVPVGDSPGHDPSDVAVVSQIGKDSRKWNYLHYSAVRNPEIMRGLLEKCRGDDSKKWDVNTPGPGGYTPLMLAVTQKSSDSFPLPSRSSSSSESSGEHTEHNGLLFSPMTKAMQFVPHSDTSSPSGSFTGSPFNCSVDVLISTRVKLDATNDYGRTGLHLAAVCARGDYVKKLLAAGANPNVQDNWGQSALHAAIGAAAEGAFQMLLDFPKTDINLKSDGGITPLMDAVKTTNMYMVKQLVKKNADISLADYEGRIHL